MSTTSGVRLIVRAAAAASMLLVLFGCAGGTDLIAAGRLTLEPRIDRLLRRPPDVLESEGDLVVSGRLERGLRRDLGGHIDVTVIGPDGAVVYDARAAYLADAPSSRVAAGPRSGVFRRAHTRYGSYGVYSLRFPGLPPDGSVVKVRHDPGPPVEDHSMRIELLGFPSCPATPTMRANLVAALGRLGHEESFEELDLEALSAIDRRRGWPAPTVLVNGDDLFGMPLPGTHAMGCRVYEGGIPSAESIAQQLRRLGSSDRKDD